MNNSSSTAEYLKSIQSYIPSAYCSSNYMDKKYDGKIGGFDQSKTTCDENYNQSSESYESCDLGSILFM